MNYHFRLYIINLTVLALLLSTSFVFAPFLVNESGIPKAVTMPPPGNSTVLPYTNPEPDGTWYGGAHMTAITDSGIRATFNVISTSVINGDCYAVWISEQLSNNYWGQVGWYNCDGSYTSFDQSWDLGTGMIVAGDNSAYGADIGDNNTYTMQYSGSGGVWDYYVNATMIGSYDFGVATSGTSYPTYMLGEVQDPSSSFSVNTDTVSVVGQTYSGSTWTSYTTATAYITSGSSVNVEGQKQNGALRANYALIGTSVADPASDSAVLWPGSGGGDFVAMFSPVITTSPSISQALNHVIISTSLSIGASVTQRLSDSIADSMSLVSSVNQGLRDLVSGSVSTFSSLSILWEGGYTESLDALESVAPSIGQGLGNTMSLASSLTSGLSTLFVSSYSITLNELESLSPSVNQRLGGIITSSAIALSSEIHQLVGNTFNASVSLSASLGQSFSMVETITVALISTVGLSSYNALLNTGISLSDSVNQSLHQSVSSTLSLLTSDTEAFSVLESHLINIGVTLSVLYNGGYYEFLDAVMSLAASLSAMTPPSSITACILLTNTGGAVSSAMELFAVGLIVVAAIGLIVIIKGVGEYGLSVFGMNGVVSILMMAILLVVGMFIIFSELGVLTSVLGCS